MFVNSMGSNHSSVDFFIKKFGPKFINVSIRSFIHDPHTIEETFLPNFLEYLKNLVDMFPQ